jgi:enterochelin esterase family protein
MIRKSAKRDIRVFLQDGSNDLDVIYGNWWLSNLQMESAPKFRDYDYEFVGGDGGHDGDHGGAILPDTLEWLWR